MYISREKIKELRYKIGDTLVTLFGTCVVCVIMLLCYKWGLFPSEQGIMYDILTIIMIITISIIVMTCVLCVFSFESWWRDV